MHRSASGNFVRCAREPRAIARGGPATAEPARGNHAAHRDHRHHDQLPPSGGQRPQSVWRTRTLRKALARGCEREHDHHVHRSRHDRRETTRPRHLRPAHDPGRRRLDRYFFEGEHFVGELYVRSGRRRIARDREAAGSRFPRSAHLRFRRSHTRFRDRDDALGQNRRAVQSFRERERGGGAELEKAAPRIGAIRRGTAGTTQPRGSWTTKWISKPR